MANQDNDQDEIRDELNGDGAAEDDVSNDELDEVEIIMLADDEGNESPFELLAVLDVDEKPYAVLTPYTGEDDEDEDDGEELEVHIFHYVEHEPEGDETEGSWSIAPIEDEALAEHVFTQVRAALLADVEAG